MLTRRVVSAAALLARNSSFTNKRPMLECAVVRDRSTLVLHPTESASLRRMTPSCAVVENGITILSEKDSDGISH
ncbi:hypothetical protein PM082_021712 [Marasmius tenuissimus]|nr:hypothetical protein PM082_021712 [Marasmius tenuissimus]